MHCVYVFLILVLGSLLEVSAAHARGSANSWTSPCTLDVVLVAFRDTTAARPLSPRDCGSSSNPEVCDYHLQDRPYGTNPGEQGTDRYSLRDFRRMLTGGYGSVTTFVGDTVTVAGGHTLPEVYGSLRAYYDSVSSGAFRLRVRTINRADGQGYPRWVELPHTKQHYAEIGIGRPLFWNDAQRTAQDSVDVWYPNTTEYDLPDNTYGVDRRLRHKVLYLYSGPTYTARSPAGLLHPQADRVTMANPTSANHVGYRYVMGEREGWGSNAHGIDEFAGIGTHAHEVGHLLGLNHGEGRWEDADNRYKPGTAPYTNARGANLLGWTLMQGGGQQGPELEDNGYSVGYRSCPNPINPFYLMDLGWVTPTEITADQDDYAIAAGTTHRIDRGAVSYLLNRRTTHPFGGRYLAFYEYQDDDPGLMIWRRETGSSGEERPILIVADERRYTDARNTDRNPTTPEYHDMLTDPFPGPGQVRRVDTRTAGMGLRQATTAMADPPPPNRKPVLSGPDSVWFAENGTDTVATYPATDADGLRWSLGGVDAAAFEMRGDTLRFQAPPDYERPGDVDGNNVYEITVSAADGSLSSPPFSLTVSVTDIKEETDLVYLGRRIRSLGGSKHAAARIVTKTVFGTVSCAAFSVISRSLHRNYIYNEEQEDPNDPWRGLESASFGLAVGIAVGFPVGVTAVDPDDSLPWTLLAGVIPAATGYYLPEFGDPNEVSFLWFAPVILIGAGPVILSLAASELWRNPSEDHRASFGIIPTPKGGLSAVTTLRF